MFLRTLSTQERQNNSDQIDHSDFQQRSLLLSHNFSVDWNSNMGEADSNQNSQNQSISLNSLNNQLYQYNQSLIYRNGQIINRENSIIEENRNIQNSEQYNISFSNIERQITNQSNNVLIISRSNHFNEEEFFEAIDFLFKQLQQQTYKPKFRHFINRIKTKCAICFGKIKRCQTICKTGCKHKFHKQCLQKWTQKNPSCPLCRKKFQ